MTHLPRLAFLLGILLAAPTVEAKSELAKAKQLFKQAEQRYKAADYRAALELYQQAFAAHPLAGFHFNIAQCHRNLGEHEKAVEHFRRYLTDSKKKPRHEAEARRLIQLSEAELAKQPTKPEPEPEPPPPIVKAATENPPPPPAPRRRRLRPPAFWTGVALTGALLAAGTITGVLALGKSSRFKDPTTPQAELTGLRDSGQTLRTTSTITFAVGAAAGVATGVLFFFTDFRGAERNLSAAPIEGGAMVNLAGAF
jgi:hypothetical protein